MTTGFQFSIKDASRLLFALIFFEMCLVLIYSMDFYLGMPRPIHRVFNLDGEATIPAWFSSVQLLLIGILFLFSAHWPKRYLIVNPRFLLVVGIAFVFLSMDETAVLHEKVGSTLMHIKWVPIFKGIWILTYFSIAVMIAITGRHTIKSMLNAYPRQVLIMFSGLIVLLIGAVGMEIIMYVYLQGMEGQLLYIVEVALEEFFEMAGASIILYGVILCALREPEALETEHQ